MAGGRRPASYVSGARHNSGVERASQPVFVNQGGVGPFGDAELASTVLNTTNGTLPPWIPSIWQPPVERPFSPLSLTAASASPSLSSMAPVPSVPVVPAVSNMPSTPRHKPLYNAQTFSCHPTHTSAQGVAVTPDTISTLASALDSAIQAAVVRVLASSSVETDWGGEKEKTEVCHDDKTDKSRQPKLESSSAAGAALGLDTLQTRADKQETNLGVMETRMDGLEAKLSIERERLQQLHALMLNVSAQIASLSASTCEYRTLIDGRISGITEEAGRGNEELNKLRLVCEDVRRMAQDATRRTDGLTTDLGDLRKKFDVITSSSKDTDSRISSVEFSVNSVLQEVAELQKERKDRTCHTRNEGNTVNGDGVCGSHPNPDIADTSLSNGYKHSNGRSQENGDVMSGGNEGRARGKGAVNADEVGGDGDDDDSDDDGGDHESSDVRRAVEETKDSVSSLKSRIRRVEGQVTEVNKQLSEAVALNAGFEQAIRATVEDVQKNVAVLFDGVRCFKGGSNVAASKGAGIGRTDGRRSRGGKGASGNNSNANANATTMVLANGGNSSGRTRDGKVSSAEGNHPGEDVEKRLSAIEVQVRSLKRLIEANLRNQVSAEAIVKEQVSLITKHVCMAMRQYTARRISENNVLIDQTLRERIPEYAKSDSQFVLVRNEHPGDASNDSVDIHQPDVSTLTTATDTVLVTATVAPSDALGTAPQENTVPEEAVMRTLSKPND